MKIKAEDFRITFQVEGPPRGGLRYRLAILLVAIASRLLRYRIAPIAEMPGPPPKINFKPGDLGPARIILEHPAGLGAPFEKHPRERGRSPLQPAKRGTGDPAKIAGRKGPAAPPPGPRPPASPAPPPPRASQLAVHSRNADGSPAKGDGEFLSRNQDGSYRVSCKRCGRPARDYFCFTDEWPPTCAGCRTPTETPTQKGGTD